MPSEVRCYNILIGAAVVEFRVSLGIASWDLTQDIDASPRVEQPGSWLELQALAPIVPSGLLIGMLGTWCIDLMLASHGFLSYKRLRTKITTSTDDPGKRSCKD